MKKILLIAFLATGLWATENLGEYAEIYTKCNKASALGIKSSLYTIDFEDLSEEDKSEALIKTNRAYSHFYEYCVRFYVLNKNLISVIEPEFVLQDFIAKGIVEREKQKRE